MTKDTVEDLFAAARVAVPVPPLGLSERVLADALAHQAEAASRVPLRAPSPARESRAQSATSSRSSKAAIASAVRIGSGKARVTARSGGAAMGVMGGARRPVAASKASSKGAPKRRASGARSV